MKRKSEDAEGFAFLFLQECTQNDREFEKELLVALEESCGSYIENLQVILKKGNKKECTLAVHFVKSSSVQIGGTLVSELGKEMEKKIEKGVEGDLSDALEMAPKFIKAYRDFVKTLRNYVERAEI